MHGESKIRNQSFWRLIVLAIMTGHCFVTTCNRLIDWETTLSSYADNPDGRATNVQDIFQSVLDIHAPLKKEE